MTRCKYEPGNLKEIKDDIVKNAGGTMAEKQSTECHLEAGKAGG
jgi:hypothetical protein